MMMREQYINAITDKYTVIISVGFGNFHMLMTAEEVYRSNALSAVICGAYPMQWIKNIIYRLSQQSNKKISRLLSREVHIPNRLVNSVWWAEMIHGLALKIRHLINKQSKPIFLDYLAQVVYQNYVKGIISKLDAPARQRGVYHYRAAYGLSSVSYAKKQGLITLCDHSLADPRILNSLVNNNGVWEKSDVRKLSAVEKAMLRDIDEADAILVNSGFVKETMVFCGCPANKIHVIYLGVDEAFVELIPEPEINLKQNGTPKILFAGMFSKRKGADLIIEALMNLDGAEWQLKIAGGVDNTIRERYPEFFNDERVTILGLLSRKELASVMTRSDVFLFPSRAEGSARVIFEALACGCYVITTREAGSIVEDGVHGRVIESNNVPLLRDVVKDTLINIEKIKKVSQSNSAFILNNYRQSHYAEQLVKLYKRLIESNI